MDIHQLRSWIFELFAPLENERQYIVFDAARGNLLIDIPAFGARPLRLIEGTGRASLLVATNASRAKEAQRYREALGVRIAAHADDAATKRPTQVAKKSRPFVIVVPPAPVKFRNTVRSVKRGSA